MNLMILVKYFALSVEKVSFLLLFIPFFSKNPNPKFSRTEEVIIFEVIMNDGHNKTNEKQLGASVIS